MGSRTGEFGEDGEGPGVGGGELEQQVAAAARRVEAVTGEGGRLGQSAGDGEGQPGGEGRAEADQ